MNMDLRGKLLWIDGLAAGAAGILVMLLTATGWLSVWYQLSQGFLYGLAAVNLIYACYSLPLAMRAERPRSFIVLLVAGNASWAVVCMILAFFFRETSSLFGLIHLVAEGLFVGGLAYLEWRWRDLLRFA